MEFTFLEVSLIEVVFVEKAAPSIKPIISELSFILFGFAPSVPNVVPILSLINNILIVVVFDSKAIFLVITEDSLK